MPELPEVETTRRGIERAPQGSSYRELRIYDPRLRWPIEADLPAAARRPARSSASVARAKYLLLELSSAAR